MTAEQYSHLARAHQEAAEEFRRRFGSEPTVVGAAPGRVNLIGEHIDYNDGFVLPMAIERYAVIAAGPQPEGSRQEALLYSIGLDAEATIPVTPQPEPASDGWARYVEGVVAGFLGRGHSVAPFRAVIASNVPTGGGLSSSAALEVATAIVLQGMNGVELSPTEVGLLCQEAEHKYAGVPCGIMDQFSSAFGKANELMLLDCQSAELKHVPFASEELEVLITNSNVKHELTGGEYAERRGQCDSALAKIGKQSWRDVSPEDLKATGPELSGVEQQRAQHVVTEIARTVDAAEAFRARRWSDVGDLMYASHASMRDDFEISVPEIDSLVEAAQELGEPNGVFGSRMTGGGFGGCTVTLVQAGEAERVAKAIAGNYKQATGIDAEYFVSRPALGAHLLKP
ncbi:MAG: galactokinase [Planctomycetota bacterium]